MSWGSYEDQKRREEEARLEQALREKREQEERERREEDRRRKQQQDDDDRKRREEDDRRRREEDDARRRRERQQEEDDDRRRRKQQQMDQESKRCQEEDARRKQQQEDDYRKRREDDGVTRSMAAPQQCWTPSPPYRVPCSSSPKAGFIGTGIRCLKYLLQLAVACLKAIVYIAVVVALSFLSLKLISLCVPKAERSQAEVRRQMSNPAYETHPRVLEAKQIQRESAGTIDFTEALAKAMDARNRLTGRERDIALMQEATHRKLWGTDYSYLDGR